MLSAIALGRIGFGLVLIVAFSLGLAGVLTVIGIVWVQARRLVERTPERALFLNRIPGRAFALRALPAASALIITVIGLGITYQALLQTGLLA
jgi:ABC-type nickel/cobalt efflux system permease component RcnA